jgi:hydrogenase/urease accessory protein HupE
MRSPQRTRSNPGPLLLILFAWLSTAGAVLDAHDPGLSALDFRVAGGGVSALLSIAAPDAELAAADAGDTASRAVGNLALNGIRLSADGQPLAAVVDRVWVEEGAVFVRLVFAAPQRPDTSVTIASNARLTIASNIPAQLARGHRQLLTVTEGERTLAQTLVDAGSAPVTVALGSSTGSMPGTAGRLFVLGIGHILAGYDHLLFIAGLLLASRHVRELIAALTAFTIAHSITLTMAAAGLVHAPASIVEPLIAASIAWIGVETLLRHRRPGLRWIVVFGFGLVHGFGFAEALIDRAPWSSPAEIAVMLLSFNAGVEAGQIAVAAALLPLVWLMRRRPQWNARLVPACSVMIACAGGYWLIERL